MRAYKGIKNRILYVDFNLMIDDRKPPAEQNYQKHKALKYLDPCFNLLGKKRRYQTPQELEKHVEEYFASCWKPVYRKDGSMVLDEKGLPIKVQVRPYTMAGLALHLDISTKTFQHYEYVAKAGSIPQEYSDIVVRARQRIEAYAEEQIYSRDGSRGAQFVLSSSFKWMTPREKADIEARKQQIKLQQKEFKLKKKMLGLGQDNNFDGQIEIRVVKADKPTDRKEAEDDSDKQ